MENAEQLKYSSIREEFEKVGLIVPVAFEKPEGNTQEISWSFKQWKDKMVFLDYYKLRASIMQVCLSIENLIAQSDMSYKKIFEGEERDVDVRNMLDNIMDLFPPNIWIENNNFLYERVVKECVGLCDKITIKDSNNLYGEEDAVCAVLKITRNWMAHQGIKNIKAFDVAFIFYTLIIAFFKYDDEKVYHDYKEIAEELVLEFEKNTKLSTDNYQEMLDKFENIVRKKYMDAHERYEKRRQEAKKKNYPYKKNSTIYETISGIGHECSDIKDTVQMQYIYLLFLKIINPDFQEDNQLITYLMNRMIESELYKEL